MIRLIGVYGMFTKYFEKIENTVGSPYLELQGIL